MLSRQQTKHLNEILMSLSILKRKIKKPILILSKLNVFCKTQDCASTATSILTRPRVLCNFSSTYDGTTVQRKIQTTETTYTDDLFIVVKVYVEPATLLGWADNRRMIHKCAKQYLRVQIQSFSFSRTSCPVKCIEPILNYNFTYSWWPVKR